MVALVAAVILGFVLGFKCYRFLEIDRCLDAGGRWDYPMGRCEFAAVK